MMPAATNQFSSGKHGTPVVYKQAYLADIAPPLRQSSEFLRLIEAYLLAPSEVSNRAYGSDYRAQQIPFEQSRASEIDFARAETAMRELAARQGVDFDGLIKAASQHFQRSDARAAEVELSEVDIQNLVDDDDQAINS